MGDYVIHQPVIRQVRGENQVSCACTWQPRRAGQNGGEHGRYEFWGVTKGWQDTVEIFNVSQHNGEFGRDDQIGYGRHKAG